MEQYFKIEEVSQKLGVHTNTVRNLLGTNEFPNSVKIGRAIRIPLSDIEAYCERQKSA